MEADEEMAQYLPKPERAEMNKLTESQHARNTAGIKDMMRMMGKPVIPEPVRAPQIDE